MWNVQLFELDYDEREAKAVAGVLDTKWLTMGEHTAKFEQHFADFLGVQACSAVSSCTAGLHLSLIAAGVGAGDEVVIPALTFVADANVVKAVGAKPVLADSESLDSWNVSLETIQRWVTPATAAIIVVHFAGYPCADIKRISEFCQKRGITLIEDVAHAPGAGIRGELCGSFGDFACFSFFSNKNLAVGEGGMVATGSSENHNAINRLRSHGMTTLTLDRHRGRAITYDVEMPGLNYRLDEIRAAIGLVQLDKLKEGNKRREELSQRYRERLHASEIMLPFSEENPKVQSAHHIMPCLLPKNTERDDVVIALREKGIQTSIHYPPFWEFEAYKGCYNRGDYPIVNEIASRELTLPLFPNMTLEQVDIVVDALCQVVTND